MAARFRFFVLGLALLAWFAAVSAEFSEHKVDGELDFSYLGTTAPEKWGSLNPKYEACGSGKAQSPINIVTKDTVKNSKLKPLVRHYHATNATLINNGFNIGLKYNYDVGELNIEGKTFSLLQMHWHTPSEHRIDGEQFPAELHLVHKSQDGALAVVGILFKYGSSDPLVSKLEDGLEKLEKAKCEKDEEAQVPIGKVDFKHMRKNNRKYFRYVGSLTTPPCTENVLWNILTKTRTISKDQVELLRQPLDKQFKKNCRPTQPLNGRKVQLFKKSEGGDDN